MLQPWLNQHCRMLHRNIRYHRTCLAWINNHRDLNCKFLFEEDLLLGVADWVGEEKATLALGDNHGCPWTLYRSPPLTDKQSNVNLCSHRSGCSCCANDNVAECPQTRTSKLRTVDANLMPMLFVDMNNFDECVHRSRSAILVLVEFWT